MNFKKNIGCGILAGGKSSRMGQDKALLFLGEQTFIERLCEELNDFEEKFIARGDRQELSAAGFNSVSDDYPHRGPMGGIHTILSLCRSEAMFLTSCDMPFLTKELTEVLCREMTEETDAVIAVTAEGRIQPLCGVYKKKLAPLMEKQILENNYRLTVFLDKITVKYVQLDEKQSLKLQNINTQEEYKKIK